MRRFLIVLLVIIAAGGLLWIFVLKPKPTEQELGSSAGGFRSLFSLGNRTDETPPETGAAFPGTETTSTEETTSQTSPFKQIGFGPVAGYTSFSLEKKVVVSAADPKQKPITQMIIEHYIRYVSRTNGYVYEIKDSGTPTQISNIYIPNVYEAYFTDNNKTVLLRFLRDDMKTIATYSIPIPDQNADGTRTQVSGTYLPDGIASLAISPEGKSIAEVIPDKDFATIMSSTTKNAGRKELIRSPFQSWTVLWPTKDIYLQTKASAAAEGFLYRLDTTNKRLVRILGNIDGLTASMSPKGTYILYSESAENSFSTILLTVKTGKKERLAQRILPEKCAWLANEDLVCAGTDSLPAADYPDSWYQGILPFDDKLYRIFSSLGAVDVLDDGDPGSYDAVQLSVSEADRHIYFIDKNTGLLWQFTY